jgi:hypothetical protein
MEATTRTPDQIVSQLVPLVCERGHEYGLPRDLKSAAEIMLRQAILIADSERITGREVHAVLLDTDDPADVAQRLYGGLNVRDASYEVIQGESRYTVQREEYEVAPPRTVTLDITSSGWEPEAITVRESFYVDVTVVASVVADETVNGRRLVTMEFEV